MRCPRDLRKSRVNSKLINCGKAVTVGHNYISILASQYFSLFSHHFTPFLTRVAGPLALVSSFLSSLLSDSQGQIFPSANSLEKFLITQVRVYRRKDFLDLQAFYFFLSLIFLDMLLPQLPSSSFSAMTSVLSWALRGSQEDPVANPVQTHINEFVTSQASCNVQSYLCCPATEIPTGSLKKQMITIHVFFFISN